MPESPDAYKLIASGTFVEGDLTVTKHGLVINPGSANGHENSGVSGNGDVGSAVASARLAAVPPSPPSPSSSSGGGVAGAAGSSEFGTLSLDDLTVLGTIGAGSIRACSAQASPISRTLGRRRLGTRGIEA